MSHRVMPSSTACRKKGCASSSPNDHALNPRDVSAEATAAQRDAPDQQTRVPSLVMPDAPIRCGHGNIVVVDNRDTFGISWPPGAPGYAATGRLARLRRPPPGSGAAPGRGRAAGRSSVDCYTRLEHGNLGGVSETVLDALAHALQLDDAECAHLFDLARAADTTTHARRRPVQQRARPSVQRILDAISDAPAYVRNGRRDILAANRLGYALYSEMYLDPARPVNVARFVFLNPRARTFFLDWESAANDIVAILRIEAGRTPYDRGLST